MNKIIKRLTASSTWGASSDLTPIDLPRDGLITEVTIRANITCTLAATAYSDYFRRIIQNLRLEGDGGRAYLGMSGTQMSTMLSLWNEITSKAPTIASNGAGIALAAPDVGSTTFNSIFKFHPGSNPHDPFDMSAVIPAQALSMLQAKLTTTGNNVVDGGANISAGTFNYEVCVVRDQRIRPGQMTPLGSTLVYAHTANYSDFSYEIDVPGGAWLRSIILRVMDDTATVPRRKNDEVTGIRLSKPKSGDYIFEQSIREIQHTMLQRFGSPGVAGDVGPIGAIADLGPRPESLQNMIPAGFVIIDLRPFGDPVYGLNLTNFQTGDLKLGLTIENYASGDASTIYWDQLQPVPQNMVGR